MIKAELFPIIQSLAALCSDDANVSVVKNLLQNGMQHYIEPEHGKKLIDQLWTLEQAVKGQKYIEIMYDGREDEGRAGWVLRPMQIMFLEFRFYLVAYVMDTDNTEPVIYQIDRIEECLVREKHFRMPADRTFGAEGQE